MTPLRPIPLQHGVGFTSSSPVNFDANNYRHEQIGRHHNYYYTGDGYTFPHAAQSVRDYTFDAFSPNLNKFLHVGHLRQLILAASFQKMFETSRFVGMLGGSVGIIPEAMEKLRDWTRLAEYEPETIIDVNLNKNQDFPLIPGEGKYEGCKVYVGKNSPVVFEREDGRLTYAAHDLIFAKLYAPDYYVTGHEQKSHFDNLGLGDKHLPMGLVLDSTGKKLKSRTGDALTAEETLTMVKENLKETPEPESVAWNVLVWNFLRVSRSKDVRFKPDDWCDPDSPGMYITYTYARIKSALDKAETVPWKELADIDLKIVGVASYLDYYLSKAMNDFDPSCVANYLPELCAVMTDAYHKEKIVGGRPSFIWALDRANSILAKGMRKLGMKVVQKV